MVESWCLAEKYLLRLVRPVLAIGLGIVGFQGLLMAACRILEASEQYGPRVQQWGDFTHSLLGSSDMVVSNSTACVALAWQNPLVLTALVALAISRGTSSVREEVQSGTENSSLVGWRGLIVHWMTTLLGLADICLTASVGTAFWLWALGMADGPDFLAVLRTGAMAFSVGAVVASLAYLLSTRPSAVAKPTSAWAISLTLLFYLVNFAGGLWTIAEPLKPYSIFHYYRPLELLHGDRGLSPDLYILLGLALILTTGAGMAHHQQDL